MRTGTPSLGRHQSFGLCLGALPTPAGLVRDTRLPPSIALPRHTHRSSYVCVVLDGSYLEDWRRQHDCRRGSILIHPANTSHANQVGPRGARCVNIELDASGFGDPDLATRLARPSHLRLPPTHAALRGLADALAATDALATHEAVLTLLDTCQDLPVSAGRPRWLGSVIDVLEADLSVSPSLTELAALAGLHPHHLAKAFKESRHETIGAYLLRRRLEWADQALRGRGESLAEIALRCGFCDQAHFTRAFRRQYGISPGHKRRLMQG